MGLFDLFRKTAAPQPASSNVLVCSVADGHEAELLQDAAIYQRYFPKTTVERFPDAASLIEALAAEYTIVHVLASIDTLGRVAGSENSGTALISRAVNFQTKLLWFAASNAPDGYIAGFNTGRQHINVVMTIDRQGDDLPNFLDGILKRMQQGMKMPVAWNDIAPQIPGRPQPNVPEQIYAAGYGAATFF